LKSGWKSEETGTVSVCRKGEVMAEGRRKESRGWRGGSGSFCFKRENNGYLRVGEERVRLFRVFCVAL
jgi:hypothetical protein